MLRWVVLTAVLSGGCAGKRCCPPVAPPPVFREAPPPAPRLFPQDALVPPVRARVEKCFKVMVTERSPYANGPDLGCEMSWKW